MRQVEGSCASNSRMRQRAKLAPRPDVASPFCQVSPWTSVVPHMLALASINAGINRDALVDMVVTPLRPADPTATLVYGEAIVAAEWAPVDRRAHADESIRDSVDRLDKAMRRAVADAMDNDDRVAVMATGGVDSAVVASFVSEVCGRPPVLWALDGGLLAGEERRRLQLLADTLGSDLRVLEGPFRFDPHALRQLNEDAPWPRGGLFSGAWAVAARALEADGFTRALTGEGANEVFSPGGAELIDLVQARSFGTAATRYGFWRDTDSPAYVRGLWRTWRSRCLPVKSWHTAASETLGWARVTRRELDGSLRRWRNRLDAERRRGLGAAEVQCRLRLDGLKDAAALDPEARVTFQHPLANEQVVAAHFAAPLTNRCPRSAWTPDKFLLRVAARRRLPAALTEAPKVGVSDQMATLTAGMDDVFDDDEHYAIQWLGLDGFPAQPLGLPASAALDWTQNRALVAWAERRLARECGG